MASGTHSTLTDDGDMWPTAFALIAMTSATEKTIVSLARRAVANGSRRAT